MYAKNIVRRFQRNFIGASSRYTSRSVFALDDTSQSFYPTFDLRGQSPIPNTRSTTHTMQYPRVICKFNEVEQHHIAIYAALRKDGVCMVEDAPIKEGNAEKTGNSPIIDMARTLGSENVEQNRSKFVLRKYPQEMDQQNRLQFTDDPYREPVHSVQMLHCVEQTPTKNVLIDRIMAANAMRERYPDEFALLSTVKRLFTYYDLTDGRIFRKYQYAITVDNDGNVESVHFNNRTNPDHHWNVDQDVNTIRPYQDAWTRFGAMLEDSNVECAIEFRF